MIVKRVHRAVKFKQSSWLAGYIKFNTANRQQAAAADDEIGKVVYKLMNNAVSTFFCILVRLDIPKYRVFRANLEKKKPV